MAWIKSLSTSKFQKDVLLVAGDVAETFNTFFTTMSILMDKFHHVFYVPGNHDLWCRSNGEKTMYLDSIDKLNELLIACRKIGVKTSPDIIHGVGIIPLFSWYHQSFDKEKDITSIRIPSLEMACKDFHACKWPGELSSRDLSLALYFDAMNENIYHQTKEIRSCCRQIITFSHFLPSKTIPLCWDYVNRNLKIINLKILPCYWAIDLNRLSSFNINWNKISNITKWCSSIVTSCSRFSNNSLLLSYCLTYKSNQI
ncbi:hypothetical protein ACHQM5_008586 [Ranunculus cassubicifolius]